MPNQRFQTKPQAGRYVSPWSTRQRVAMFLWRLAWGLLCRPSPKCFGPWRRAVLRGFGATVTGRPFVASSARIRIPWLLTLEDRACIGEEVEVYNLGPITLRARCTVAQQTYLCAGSHDFADLNLPLTVAPIVVEEEAFIGVRALVLPGVVIGAGAVIGGGAVVTRDMPAWTICAGNPCRPLKPRGRSGPPAT